MQARAEDAGGLRIARSRATGLARFVTAVDGGAIPVPAAVAGARPSPRDFLRVHGALFGVVNPDAELVEFRSVQDARLDTHTSFRQVVNGVPVFGGVLRVHQDAAGDVFAANGHYFPIPAGLNTLPAITLDAAVARASAALQAGNLAVEHSEVVVVDPGWYGDPPAGAHLAYYLILADIDAPIREAFFVEAHTGKILDRWNLLHTARNRIIRDDSLPGDPVVRIENGPATGDFDTDAAYDYSGDTYDYLFRAFGRDSYDGNGLALATTVHWESTACPNAQYIGDAMRFCTGVVTDDVVAHEFGHGLTEYTANLIYQNQPGQLNESFSDVIGEAVDLLNGDVSDIGPPGGTPWPLHGTGPGTDTPNNARTACVAGALMTINSPAGVAGDYSAQPASFGPPLTVGGTSGDVVLAEPIRACSALTNAGAVAGKIALVDRGDCTFTSKVKNAQNAGAVAVIVANNVSSGLSPMGGSDATIVIPSVGSSQADGNTIKTALQTDTVNVTLHQNADPEARWMVGEDSASFGGAIRDMWMPSCMGDPDRANDPLQICAAADNGGVHSGSGVPNHAFAIATDGKTFNGQTVTGIGLFKAAAVWYRALDVYLTPTSDFEDAYTALNQAAADLVGDNISDPRDASIYGVFTQSDADEINKALLAVEMNTRGRCGANEVLDADPPTECTPRDGIYFDDFESGVNGWTVSHVGPFGGGVNPYDWTQESGGLPDGWPGTVWFCDDLNAGNCGTQDESAAHSLFSPSIVMPMGVNSPTLAFNHFMESEALWDGGNIKISVNGGSWQSIPDTAFSYNTYNATLNTSADGNTNPLAGERAWSGGSSSGNTWGKTVINLSSFVSGGETIQFRFDFGKDGCTGADGWYVDDFEIYQCGVPGAPPAVVPLPNGEKTRALSFTEPPAAVADGADPQTAIKVTMIDLQNPVPANDVCCPPPDFSSYEAGTCSAAGEANSCARWVGSPATYLEAQELPGFGSYRAARLQCAPYYHDWGGEGLVHVVGADIVPSSTYSVEVYAAACKGDEANCTLVSNAVEINTRRAGDIAPVFQDPAANRTQPNAIDIVGAVNNFKKAVGAPKHIEAQVQPNLPNLNRDVDALDIQAVVANQKLGAYPYSGPCACPSTVVCNATMCSGAAPCPGGNLCVQTCSAGPRTGEPCTANKHCGTCVGGTRPGIPCDANSQCDGGTCSTGTCNTQGFCRDKCGRCTP